jgi:transcriptional regulator with XRE-family HTH domain
MPHPTDIHVGARLRDLRVARGLSQTDLGNKLDVSFQQVQKCEKGINRIGASRLLQCATALGVSVSYFFDGLDMTAASGPVPMGPPPSRKSIRTAQRLDALPPDVRGTVHTLVDSLCSTAAAPANGVRDPHPQLAGVA